MLWSVASLLSGEALVLVGLWMAWPPLALLAAGLQLVGYALMRNEEPDASA